MGFFGTPLEQSRVGKLSPALVLQPGCVAGRHPKTPLLCPRHSKDLLFLQLITYRRLPLSQYRPNGLKEEVWKKISPILGMQEDAIRAPSRV